MGMSLIRHKPVGVPVPQEKLTLIGPSEVGNPTRKGRIKPEDGAYQLAQFEGEKVRYWIVLREERVKGSRHSAFEYFCQEVGEDGTFLQVFMKTCSLSPTTFTAGSKFGKKANITS